MKIIIPVSKADIHLLDKWTQLVLKFGGLKAHKLVFSVSRSIEERVKPYAEQLNEVADSAIIMPIADFDDGWFVGANRHFHATIIGLALAGNKEPFFFMELDCYPVKEGWADALHHEYAKCGKPFMGVVSDLYAIAPDGSMAKKDGETYMQGCGVYPANIQLDPDIYPVFNGLRNAPPNAPDKPFDVHLRHVTRRKGVAVTRLLDDKWQTCNYRHASGFIQCDNTEIQFKANRRAGVIQEGAMLVHGCKDESLPKLLLGVETQPVEQVEEKEESKEEEDIFNKAMPWTEIEKVVLDYFGGVENMTHRGRLYFERVKAKREYDAKRGDPHRRSYSRQMYDSKVEKKRKRAAKLGESIKEPKNIETIRAHKKYDRPKKYIERIENYIKQDIEDDTPPPVEIENWPTCKAEVDAAFDSFEGNMRISKLMMKFNIKKVGTNTRRFSNMIKDWGYKVVEPTWIVSRVTE